MDDIQDALAGCSLAPFVQEGSHNHELVESDLVCRNKSDDSKDGYTITQLINIISYSTSFSNDMPDISVTFLAKRFVMCLMRLVSKYCSRCHPLRVG